MNTWGGKRKGAGRRKGSTKETRVKVTAYLLPETKVFIDDLAIRKGSKGKAIDFLINQK